MRFEIPAALFFAAAFAVVAPCGATDSNPAVFHLELAHDQTRDATFIQPRSDGTLAYVTVDSAMEYVTMTHVRRITDAGGADLTSRVLKQRNWLGVAPPRTRRATAAQTWRSFRLRAGPGNACGSYMLTDLAILGTSIGREADGYLVADFGYARNVAPSASVGASAFLAGESADRVQLGARIHLIRWVTRDLSASVAPGLVLVEDEDYSHLDAPGYCAQAGLTWKGRIGVVGQVLSVQRRRELFHWWLDSPAPEVEEHETSWRLGLRLGAEPGIIGTAAFLVGEAITHMSTKIYVPPIP